MLTDNARYAICTIRASSFFLPLPLFCFVGVAKFTSKPFAFIPLGLSCQYMFGHNEKNLEVKRVNFCRFEPSLLPPTCARRQPTGNFRPSTNPPSTQETRRNAWQTQIEAFISSALLIQLPVHLRSTFQAKSTVNSRTRRQDIKASHSKQDQSGSLKESLSQQQDARKRDAFSLFPHPTLASASTIHVNSRSRLCSVPTSLRVSSLIR